MGCCDWRGYEEEKAALRTAVAHGERACQPFPVLLVSDDPAEQRRCAELFVADDCHPAAMPLWNGERYDHDRLRIAYLSADFHDHATAYLMAQLFECHDRKRFEVTAVSFGPPSDGAMRRRIEAAVEHFVDWRCESDRAIAGQLRAREIDIAIDLKGYTQNARPRLLAQRSAPLQIGFLGYPGTTGAPYIDYLVADRQLIPESEQHQYSERIAFLPECYQPNDALRPIDERVPSRGEVGLPDGAFVFCSFNDSYKITPEVFACWLRLLERTPGSVLWLLESHRAAVRNLRATASQHGIAPERLVFAPRQPLDRHLARHRCADLFLDTSPVTAHTTASDSLWAGLPLLTCRGRSMAARVAASLLTAVGLPELVTDSLADYEARALEIPKDRATLAALRERLWQNRATTPLFDADRFRRHFEAALDTMHARQAAGLPPESFEVPREACGEAAC
jgi:predicted O-linked N-acetylglucosamine transferase (SPINDLY family)